MTKEKSVAVTKDKAARAPATLRDPFMVLRDRIDRLFDDFAWPDMRFPLAGRLFDIEGGSAWESLGGALPPVDLVETEGGYELRAELPGMSEKNIEVKLTDGMIAIRGEKSAETTKEEENYHLRERTHGSFQRSFRLPPGIEADKVAASFSNGVLKVMLPKSPASQEKERKVAVKAA